MKTSFLILYLLLYVASQLTESMFRFTLKMSCSGGTAVHSVCRVIKSSWVHIPLGAVIRYSSLSFSFPISLYLSNVSLNRWHVPRY